MTDEFLYILIVGIPLIGGYLIPSIVEKILEKRCLKEAFVETFNYSDIQKRIDEQAHIDKKAINKTRRKCKHINRSWYVYNPGMFMCISGETRYLICNDCKKVLSDVFVEYERMEYK